jgi:glucose/mannose-6-phosphate isomerase
VGHPLERVAGLIAHTDYASVYLALAIGADPAPGRADTQLRARIS